MRAHRDLEDTSIGRAILSADKILDLFGTADEGLGVMTAEVAIDNTELIEDPEVIIPRLRISRMMGSMSVLEWSHEVHYVMSSGITSRLVFLHQNPEPYADIMVADSDAFVGALHPNESRLFCKATPDQEIIIERDLARITSQ